MKTKNLVITFLFTVLLIAGIFFPMNAVRAEEKTEAAGVEESNSTNMNIVMYTKEKVKAMSGAGSNYDVVTELNAEEPVVVTAKTDNNWYEFYFEGTVAYIPIDQLKEAPVDESLVKEMEELAKNDVVEIESFVRQQKEAKRARVWGIVIAVLIVAIFALGIISTLRASKTAEGNAVKKGDKDPVDKEINIIDLEDGDESEH